MNVNYTSRAYYLAILPKQQGRSTVEGMIFDPMYDRRNKDAQLTMEVCAYDQQSQYQGEGTIQSLALVARMPLRMLAQSLHKEYGLKTETRPQEIDAARMLLFRIKPRNLERLVRELGADPGMYAKNV